MLEFTNKQRFSIEISILSNIDKKVLKFKRLFYAQGTEVQYKLQFLSQFGPIMCMNPHPTETYTTLALENISQYDILIM